VVTTPQGIEVAFSGVFREIDPPHRIQRTERFEGMPGSECLVTLAFDEKDGQTMFTLHMLFQSEEQRDACLRSGMELGLKECYQKIDELVATL
jgi:uncharacterized protein YndB with AHSA1/START domain